jgi:hypothetical protein
MAKVCKSLKFVVLKSNGDLIVYLTPELKEHCDSFNESIVKPYWSHENVDFCKFHLTGGLLDSNKKKIDSIQLIPRQSVLSGAFRSRVVKNQKDGKEYLNLDLIMCKCENIEADIFAQL